MPLSPLIGLGLRNPHYNHVLDERPPIGWFEVHSENFFHQGGPSIEMLSAVRAHYPLSLHGVGLSLGSAGGISQTHLDAIKQLIERVDPFLVSEHLSWSRVGDIVMPDLLPIPYTEESLQIFCRNVNVAQDYLRRELLIENPSTYIEYKATEMGEMDFLTQLCERTGAKMLLDVNNIFVSSCNHGWDAKAYIDAIPGQLVKEIHLAGHSVKTISPNQLLRIDTHDQCVCEEVWALYAHTIAKIGAKPTLLEWDAQIPAFSVLLDEAAKAQNYLALDQGAYEYA